MSHIAKQQSLIAQQSNVNCPKQTTEGVSQTQFASTTSSGGVSRTANFQAAASLGSSGSTRMRNLILTNQPSLNVAANGNISM